MRARWRELARPFLCPDRGARLQRLEGDHNGAPRAGGFSLHAGIDIQPGQREKLERLCRYGRRPPLAAERLALTSSGLVRYQLKTPYQAKGKTLALGVYPDFSLEKARSRHQEARCLVASGIDPSARKQELATTARLHPKGCESPLLEFHT
jgi:hypothetical protein